jgi:WD40 repeat protein/tRNA A-37 threonylcarbamoyl transferase component Bud32
VTKPLRPAEAPTVTAPPPLSSETVSQVTGALDHLDAAVATRVLDVPGYEIISELGRGGMGVVYKARQVKLGRIVALKMILAGGHASVAQTERFRAEAEAIARLEHPNIVAIHEVGEHHGLPYFSLEFCAGGNLTAKLSGTPFPPRDAAALIEQLARAMDAAHAKGIVHRDLKPGNVLLAVDGTPKITDFGLAKKIDEEGLTATGAVLGTPSYMAPEQASGGGKQAGPECDVYALGAILYECLTGRPPFRAATAMDTIIQVMNEEPAAPRRLNPQVPRDLETICLKCLHKESARRYKSARSLASDLRRYLDGRPVQARPVGKAARTVKWVRRNPVVAGLLALVALALVAGALGMWWQYRKLEDERDRARDNAAAAKKLELLAGQARDNARFQQYRAEIMLHAGRLDQARSALVAGNSDKARELLFQCDATLRGWEWDHLFGRLPQRTTGRDPLSGPFGRLVPTFDVSGIGLKDTVTGRSFIVPGGLEAGFPGATAISADGSRVAAIVSRMNDLKDLNNLRLVFGLIVWDAATGHEIFVDKNLGAWGTLAGHLSFSPQGRCIVATGYRDLMKPNLSEEVWLWDVTSGRRVLAARDVGSGAQPRFSADESRLLIRDRLKGLRVWDTRDGTHVCDLLDTPTAADPPVAFAPKGADAAIVHGRHIAIWDLYSGRERLTLGGHTRNVTALAYSPDGMRLVTAAGETGSAGELIIWDARAGYELKKFESPPGPVQDVVFSPDCGQFAIAISSATGVVEITLRDARTGRVQFSTRGYAGPLTRLHFSASGNKLGLSDRFDQKQEWDVPSHEPIVLQGSSVESTPLAFSRDGRRLFSVIRTGPAKAASAPTPSGVGVDRLRKGGRKEEERVVQPMDRLRAWDVLTGLPLFDFDGFTSGLITLALSPDGSRLIGRTQFGGVSIWDPESGKQLVDFQPPKGTVRAAACNPNGSRAAVAFLDPEVRIWDAGTGKEVTVLRGHKASVVGLAFSADGSKVVTTCLDQTVRIWDASLGTLLTTFEDLRSSFRTSAFNPDGSRMVSVGSNLVGRVWDATTGKTLFELKGRRAEIDDIAFSPDGTLLTAHSISGLVRVWDAHNGELIGELRAAIGPTALPTVLPGGSRLVAAAGAAIKVLDTRTGQELLTVEGGAADVRRLVISPNGEFVAGASADGSVRIWDGRRRAETFEFEAGMLARTVAFSPDGTHLAACATNGDVRVWDLRSRQEVLSNRAIGSGFWHVDFSPDSARVIVSSPVSRPIPGNRPAEIEKSVLRLAWDLSSESMVEARSGDAPEPDPKRGAEARSPDGRLIARAEGRAVVVRRVLSTFESRSEIEADQAASLRWHMARVEEADKAGDAIAARFHREHLVPLLDRFVAANPGVPGPLQSRGECLLRLSRIPPAMRDFANPAVARSMETSVLARHARALMAIGDADGYRHFVSNWDSTAVAAAAVRLISRDPLPPRPGMFAAVFQQAVTARDPAALRALSGLLLRDGKSADALQAAQMALALRNKDEPPVEEALLALAFHDLKRPDDARRWLAVASERLDRRRHITAAADWVGGGAIGLWELTRPRLPLSDSWPDPASWDGWFDADTLRAEARAKIQP